MFEKCDSSNRQQKWMVAPFSKFTAKFGLAFVPTLENTFSGRFHFQANRKSIDSSKKRH